MKRVRLLLALPLLLAFSATAAERPNIVLLMGDDHGWDETGYNGHPYLKTPVLDEMARTGLRLDRFYSGGASCSPTRATVMTGRHHHRSGTFAPGWSTRPQEITVAQLLKSAGYHTFHAGKWHLNSRTDGTERTPGDAGFDHWLYTQNNAAPSHLNPTNFIRNGRPAGPLTGPSSHLVVAEATRWLDETKRAPDAPFFLNLWFHETHEPVAAADEFLAQYPNDTNLDRRHYFGAATQVDAAIGKLLKYLDDHQLRENTFIFFTSDNGPETLNRYKGAERSYGSPGPLRGMKLHLTEAGYRVPGIIRWPGHAQAGTTSAEPICNLDFLPTACALVGVALPGARALDGGSLLPLFLGQPVQRSHPLYWQYDFTFSKPWAVSVRDGRWKLLANAALDRFELYDLTADVGEKRDVAAQHPDRVKTMAATMRSLHTEIAAEGAKSGNPSARQNSAKRE